MRRQLPWLVVVLASLSAPACGPEPESPPQAGEPSPVDGTYDLDAEALVDSYVRMAMRELEAGIQDGTLAREAHQSLIDQSRRHAAENFASLETRFVFAEDGTFTSTGSNGVAKGTWVWEQGALTLSITEQGGAPIQPPAVLPGAFKGDLILVQPEPDKDYAMTLRRVTP